MSDLSPEGSQGREDESGLYPSKAAGRTSDQAWALISLLPLQGALTQRASPHCLQGDLSLTAGHILTRFPPSSFKVLFLAR